MSALGLLARIPLDVRKLIYVLRGVAKVFSMLSRGLYDECQYGLDHRRRVEPLTCREVVLYLEQHPGRVNVVPGMRLCPRNVASWNGELIRWNLVYGRKVHNLADGSEVTHAVMVDHGDKGDYRPWGEVRATLVAMEGELVLERYVAESVLERRLRRERVKVREAYARRQYRRLVRRALDTVLAPIGYTASRFIGAPLIEGTLDIDPRVRRSDLRISRRMDTAGLDPELLLGVLVRLKTVCEACQDEVHPRNPDTCGVDSIPARILNVRELVTSIRMNMCVLRDREMVPACRGGPITGRELLEWMRTTGDG